MPLIRKRRAVRCYFSLPTHFRLTKSEQQAEASPSPPRTGRRASPSVSEASSGNEVYDDGATINGGTQGAGSSHEQMVKKLVRLALASEYSRQPIRRTDITAKGVSGRHFTVHEMERADDRF